MNSSLAPIVYIISISVNVFAAILFKYFDLNGVININQMIFIRTLISIFILSPFNFSESTKQIKNSSKKEVLLILFIGVLSTADCYFFNMANIRIPVNNLQLIVLISPLITSFFSRVLLRESMTKRVKVSIILNLLSVLTLCRMTISGSFLGYSYIFIAISASCLSIVLTKKISNNYSSLILLYFRLIVMLPISIIFISEFDFNQKIFISGLILALLYIIERALSIIAYRIADSVSSMQPFRYFNMILSSLFGYIILGEILSIHQALVFVIIITTSIWTLLEKK